MQIQASAIMGAITSVDKKSVLAGRVVSTKVDVGNESDEEEISKMAFSQLLRVFESDLEKSQEGRQVLAIKHTLEVQFSNFTYELLH